MLWHPFDSPVFVPSRFRVSFFLLVFGPVRFHGHCPPGVAAAAAAAKRSTALNLTSEQQQATQLSDHLERAHDVFKHPSLITPNKTLSAGLAADG